MTHFREIKAGELEEFTESQEFRLLDPKPITLIRALSQARNPRARPDDTVLIMATEGNQLLGFAGLLPDWAQGDPALPLSSNTGWWVDPKRGRHLSLPIFARALNACHRRMLLTDATDHTRRILEKTGWFYFAPPVSGKKAIFRAYATQYTRRRFRYPVAAVVTQPMDAMINLAFITLPQLMKRRKKETLVLKESDEIDSQASLFISECNAQEFIRRNKMELEWALTWKWLHSIRPYNNENYPFSLFAPGFKQKIITIKEGQRMAGVAILNIRDRHATVPYLYVKEAGEQKIWGKLTGYLKESGAISCTSYRPGWIEFLENHRFDYLFAKKAYRHMAVTHELVPLWQKFPDIQDGDGDNIFT